ncbi:WecB/TagA/CpsF family glycosyltransferase [Microbispora bryophytorum]|uniref:WecB/TagA/CpsF family glycosyltransferase n=1 Tax=Microbispora bryophytorum TaxID=1460882 RepID=UPI001E41A80F|nr:WecB/TagA/CpsF family glycosyltransferase [Microbispora bryophytorum]
MDRVGVGRVGVGRVGADTVRVGGVLLDPLTHAQVVARVMAALERGTGGHLVTPNVDICRAAARDPSLRALIDAAELAVADGMPLVWASRLLGRPLPERVTGADLIWSLSAAAAARGVPVYLVGGPPGVAEAARDALCGRHPGLNVEGVHAPPYGFETSPAALAEVRGRLVAARPSLVFVGLGFPRQDRLVAQLRADLPGAWFVGCGAAIAFAAGSVRRAPGWMGDHGLEWLFRLISEPQRLARRYLVDDLPFALRLLSGALLRRAFGSRSRH